MREYNVDILDFYRGSLSARRLNVLIQELSPDSSTSRAMNGGLPPMSRGDHLLSDLWALIARQPDHPKRAAIVARVRNAKKLEKHKRMQARYGIKGGEA